MTRKKQSQNAVQSTSDVGPSQDPLPRRPEDRKLACEVLLTVLQGSNNMFSEGIDLARLDAAEALFEIGENDEMVLGVVRDVARNPQVSKRTRVRAATLLLKWS